LRVLEEFEVAAYPTGIPEALLNHDAEALVETEEAIKKRGLRAGLISLFKRWYPYLREMFLSVAQSRKARGGSDFQLQFAHLLTLMEIPYEMVESTFRVDFFIPDKATFDKNRTTAMIVSVKRTLRERWREVVEELYNTRAPNVFLLTADEDFSEAVVDRISDYNIHLLVWDEIKKERFGDKGLVLSLTDWGRNILPAFEKRWR